MLKRSMTLVEKALKLYETKLYHATLEPYLDGIKKSGLGNSPTKNYPDSKDDVVYLASDPEEAISYAEVAETPEEYKIIVFEIDVNDLDSSKLSADRNVIGGKTTFEYKGVIPFTALKEIR